MHIPSTYPEAKAQRSALSHLCNTTSLALAKVAHLKHAAPGSAEEKTWWYADNEDRAAKRALENFERIYCYKFILEIQADQELLSARKTTTLA